MYPQMKMYYLSSHDLVLEGGIHTGGILSETQRLLVHAPFSSHNMIFLFQQKSIIFIAGAPSTKTNYVNS